MPFPKSNNTASAATEVAVDAVPCALGARCEKFNTLEWGNGDKPEDEALAETLATIEQMKADGDLGDVEVSPDFLFFPHQIPNDPLLVSSGSYGRTYKDLWGHYKINAFGAWDIATGIGAVVAVLDTGVDAGHPDLAGQLLTGYNFYDNNANTADGEGHGTHVTGTIAAAANNSIGMAGIAFSAKVIPIKVCGSSGCPWSAERAIGGYDTSAARAAR